MSNFYFRFYPSDWTAGCTKLTAAERGVYISLISLMYDSGQPVAFDAARLARSCGTTEAKFRKMVSVLVAEDKIKFQDGGLWNSRVEKELQFLNEKSTKARGSAKTRWTRKNSETPEKTKTDRMRTHSEGNADAMHAHADSINHKPESPLPPTGGSAGSALAELKKGIMRAFQAAGSMSFPDTHRAAIWLEKGYRPAIILATISECLARDPTIQSLTYFQKAIERAHAVPEAPTVAKSANGMAATSWHEWAGRVFAKDEIFAAVAEWNVNPASWDAALLGPPPFAEGCVVREGIFSVLQIARPEQPPQLRLVQ